MLKQTLLTESGEFVHLCYCLCISRYSLAIQTLSSALVSEKAVIPFGVNYTTVATNQAIEI